MFSPSVSESQSEFCWLSPHDVGWSSSSSGNGNSDSFSLPHFYRFDLRSSDNVLFASIPLPLLYSMSDANDWLISLWCGSLKLSEALVLTFFTLCSGDTCFAKFADRFSILVRRKEPASTPHRTKVRLAGCGRSPMIAFICTIWLLTTS